MMFFKIQEKFNFFIELYAKYVKDIKDNFLR